MPVDKDRRALSNYRLEKVTSNLKAAKLMFDNNLFLESINRSYYCIFHSVRALIAYDKFDSRKQSTIIAYFNQNYIKPCKIEREYSKILSKAFKIRNDSDYKDFYLVTKEETKEQLENAEKFLKRIKEYIEEVYG
jgi:uncharacterized protein (UPF0332 family)